MNRLEGVATQRPYQKSSSRKRPHQTLGAESTCQCGPPCRLLSKGEQRTNRFPRGPKLRAFTFSIKYLVQEQWPQLPPVCRLWGVWKATRMSRPGGRVLLAPSALRRSARRGTGWAASYSFLPRSGRGKQLYPKYLEGKCQHPRVST